jgi:hypothetical protein
MKAQVEEAAQDGWEIAKDRLSLEASVSGGFGIGGGAHGELSANLERDVFVSGGIVHGKRASLILQAEIYRLGAETNSMIGTEHAICGGGILFGCVTASFVNDRPISVTVGGGLGVGFEYSVSRVRIDFFEGGQ